MQRTYIATIQEVSGSWKLILMFLCECFLHTSQYRFTLLAHSFAFL